MFAWSWISADEPLLDEACSLGVADACAWMSDLTQDDPGQSRSYLETACQLELPMACLEVHKRLTPTCEHDCYAVDEAQARERSRSHAAPVGVAPTASRHRDGEGA